MKINPFRPVNVNPYTKQLDKVNKLDSAKRGDKLEISSEALELQKGGNQVDLERQQRVSELKDQVQSGEYKIDPQEIARKLYSYWNNE